MGDKSIITLSLPRQESLGEMLSRCVRGSLFSFLWSLIKALIPPERGGSSEYVGQRSELTSNE